MISSMGADLPTVSGLFGLYLRLKSDADAYLRSTELDWTIVRPAGLLGQRLDETRMTMAEADRGVGSHHIDVATAALVPDINPFPADESDR